MKKIFLFLALASLIGACSPDYIAADLSEKSMSFYAPADRDTASTTTPLFWWSEINGATTYRLQLVWPSFAAPQQIIYDSAISGDRFYPVLQAGLTYEWRMRPENGSSEGIWVTRTLTVDSSVSLNLQTIVFLTPATNPYITQNNQLSLTWNNINGATLYRIQVVDNSNSTTIDNVTSTAASYSNTFAEGNYTVSVRAENQNSLTAWTTKTLIVDQTAPTAPVLILPADAQIFATSPGSISFDWTSSNDALTDSLFISTDSTFAASQVSLLLNASQGAYTWPGVQNTTTYYWRVNSTDAAGNTSNYTTRRRFTVN
ncbi:MAG: hypothetical protein ACRCYO_17400 [Bacteroidia bacterium]